MFLSRTNFEGGPTQARQRHRIGPRDQRRISSGRTGYLAALLAIIVSPAAAFDCDTGIYAGLGESNGIVANLTCGAGWRIVAGTPLKQDDDDWWGFTNNRFDYMLGFGYRHHWRKFRFEAALAYVNEETKLYDQHQWPLWFRISYEILPSWNCGVVHSSVAFVDDAGRNQVGCDYTFSFD